MADAENESGGERAGRASQASLPEWLGGPVKESKETHSSDPPLAPLRKRRDSSRFSSVVNAIRNSQDLKTTLVKFEVSRWLQKRKAKMEKPQPPPEMKQILRQCFDILDADRTGSVEADEILKGCRALGLKVTKEYVDTLIKNVDQDGSGSVDFDEFCEAMISGQKNEGEEAEDWTKKKLYTKDEQKKETPYVSFDLMAVGLRRKAILDCIFEGRHQDPMLQLPDTSAIIDRDRHPFMRELFMPKPENEQAAPSSPGMMRRESQASIGATEDVDDNQSTASGATMPAENKSFLKNKMTMKRGILLAAQIEKKKVKAHSSAMDILKEWPSEGKGLSTRRNSMDLVVQMTGTPGSSTAKRSPFSMGPHEPIPLHIHEVSHKPKLVPGNLWDMRGVWLDREDRVESYGAEETAAPRPQAPPTPSFKRQPSIRVASIARLDMDAERKRPQRKDWKDQVSLTLDGLNNVMDGAQTVRDTKMERLVGTEPASLTERGAIRRFEMRWGRRKHAPTLPRLARTQKNHILSSDIKF